MTSTNAFPTAAPDASTIFSQASPGLAPPQAAADASSVFSGQHSPGWQPVGVPGHDATHHQQVTAQSETHYSGWHEGHSGPTDMAAGAVPVPADVHAHPAFTGGVATDAGVSGSSGWDVADDAWSSLTTGNATGTGTGSHAFAMPPSAPEPVGPTRSHGAWGADAAPVAPAPVHAPAASAGDAASSFFHSPSSSLPAAAAFQHVDHATAAPAASFALVPSPVPAPAPAPVPAPAPPVGFGGWSALRASHTDASVASTAPSAAAPAHAPQAAASFFGGSASSGAFGAAHAVPSFSPFSAFAHHAGLGASTVGTQAAVTTASTGTVGADNDDFFARMASEPLPSASAPTGGTQAATATPGKPAVSVFGAYAAGGSGNDATELRSPSALKGWF